MHKVVMFNPKSKEILLTVADRKGPKYKGYQARGLKPIGIVKGFDMTIAKYRRDTFVH